MARSRPLVAALFAAVMLAACASHAQAATAAGTLGTAVTVAANTQTTINYGTFSVVVAFAAESTVTVNSVASVSNALPTGYTALSFATYAGLEYSFTGGPAAQAALITTPALDSASSALITGSVTAAALRWDATAQAYTKLDGVSYTAGTQTLSFRTMSAGTFVFAAAAATAAVPTLYQEFRDTSSTSATLTFPGGFEMDVATPAGANKVMVIRNTVNSNADPAGYHNVGAFFTINLMTSASVTSELRYTYDASLSDAIADDLKFASYTSGAWAFEATGGSVDTNTRVVSQTTTHFSDWGVFQNSDDDEGFTTSDQALTSASPTKCYAVDYDHFAGVVNFKLTKKSGAGNLRMYLKKTTSGCPNAADFQMQTQLVSDDGGSDTLCINSGTTPPASDGRFVVAVYAEGLSTAAGDETKFDVTVRNALFCSASPVTKVLSLAALAILAAVAAMLA